MRTHGLTLLFLSLALCTEGMAGERSPLRWDESESSVALVQGENVVWQFNHGRSQNVPFFHPLSADGGRVITCDRPSDHAWHHGLWFSWKYINGVNYWEHDGKTGKPEGRTRTTRVQVETRDDHSARISLTLVYHPAGQDQIVLSERRRIDIAAPNSQGEYHLDWTAEFTASGSKVELDRTPPKAQSWGGYAGLSVRFAEQLNQRQATSEAGPIEFGPGDRHRSHATSMDYSGVIDNAAVGLAFLDHPDNPRHPTPWYVIRGSVISYINAALLNDEPMTLEPGEQMTLRYRLIIHPNRWNAARLQTAREIYWRSVVPETK